MNKKIINILLPLPFNHTFQYFCNVNERIDIGDFVTVPFKNKEIVGCVWENKNKSNKKLPQNKIRFTVSGSADTSSNYDRCSLQIYTNQNIFTSNGENQDHISSLGLGTSLTQGDMGILTLFNFPNSSEYSFITREQIQTNSSSELAGIIGGAVLTVAQATDGVQFHASTGNIASGNFKLYGYVF